MLDAFFDLEAESHHLPLEQLFDDLAGVVFFIKDRQGRYRCVNNTLVARCALATKQALIGKRPSELFPALLADRYEQQDRDVLRSGKSLYAALEIHLYPDRSRGWCITNKYPIRSRTTGRVAGIMGISRDVDVSVRQAGRRELPGLARVLDLLHSRITDPPKVEELARLSGQSMDQFNHLIFRLFRITPRQLIMKTRLDEALHRLSTTDQTLAEIAAATGFCDQSAFTRHFRKHTGVPPGAFRSYFSKSPGQSEEPAAGD